MLGRKLVGTTEHVRDRDGLVESPESLRSPAWFREHPMASFAIVFLSTLCFAALGYNLLVQGPLTQLDQSLYEQLIGQAQSAPPRINELMIFGFFIGKQVIIVIVTILSIYFVYHRFWPEIAMLWISSPVGSFIWNFFVNFFARPRPAVQTGLEVRSVPSFPSGHAMSAMIVYGFLAYLFIPKMPSPLWKWILGAFLAVVILFDGFSRIYQGSHYLTDVLAGYALGLAWAVLVCTLIEIIFMRKKV